MNPDLSQLRDIHLPAPVSWWPPAPGWWLLLAIILLAVIGIGLVVNDRRRNAWRRTALAELASLREQYQAQPVAPQRSVADLSVLMRRVAISRFPRDEAAKLSGGEWLAFLDRNGRTGAGFQSELGRLLVVAPYSQETTIVAAELIKLFALCEGWIGGLPARGRR